MRRELEGELAELRSLRAEFNPFFILDNVHLEQTHARMLAWLADSRRSPCADSFLAALAKTRKLPVEFSPQTRIDVEVPMGDGRLDLLVSDEGTGSVWALELKAFSGDHDDQLRKYATWCKTRYVGRRWKPPVFTYLTPRGDNPSTGQESGPWRVMAYGDLVKAIDAIRSALPRESGSFVDWYVQATRKTMMQADASKQRQREIWSKFHDEIESIRRCVESDEKLIRAEIVAARDVHSWKQRANHVLAMSPSAWGEVSKGHAGPTTWFRFDVSSIYASGVQVHLMTDDRANPGFRQSLAEAIEGHEGPWSFALGSDVMKALDAGDVRQLVQSGWSTWLTSIEPLLDRIGPLSH